MTTRTDPEHGRRARRAVATGPEVLADGEGPEALAFQLAIQDGVVTRWQLEQLGISAVDLRRMVRRRELVRAAPGVFVNHTGEPSWAQRAWIATLACWPAALAGESVWRETDIIEIWSHRRVTSPKRVLLRLSDHVEERTNWMRSPPRQVIEHAVLDVAARAKDDHRAVGVLTDRIQARDTSARQLLAALTTRERTPRGQWLALVLGDIETGANSVLEHEYLVRVERPHGLPTAGRQVRGKAGQRTVERDVEYAEFGLVVELDGRTHHEGATARDRDLDRDLAAAVDGKRSVRLGWGQVLGRPCRTAGQISRLLAVGGWTGRCTRCPNCP